MAALKFDLAVNHGRGSSEAPVGCRLHRQGCYARQLKQLSSFQHGRFLFDLRGNAAAGGQRAGCAGIRSIIICIMDCIISMRLSII